MNDLAPTHLISLHKNLKDVTHLLEVHALVSRRVAGRATALQVLNRSAIVLLAACWEAYIEELAIGSFDWLLNECSDPNVFPNKVRAKAIQDIRSDKNELAIWKLAGAGWKSVLIEHRDETIARAIGTFNTPKSQQIDALFNDLIGLSKLSIHWRWSSMPAEKSCERLDQMLTVRGNIAHRVRHNTHTKRPEVDSYVSLINRLALQSHNAVTRYLLSVTNVSPWAIQPYKSFDNTTAYERLNRMTVSWEKKN